MTNDDNFFFVKYVKSMSFDEFYYCVKIPFIMLTLNYSSDVRYVALNVHFEPNVH